MSPDLFVGCFEEGQLASAPPQVVMDAFACHALAVEPDCCGCPDDSQIACRHVYLGTSAPLATFR